MTPPFAFSSVVGQQDAKLALLLCAIDPAIGGVLLRGEKGTAKTTVARALAGLLPGEARFVELPLGATEDRLVGALDLTEMLTGGTQRLRPGLLALADGGVLYVDEVNLLADHLVDVLLDVATSGVNRIERDGIAHSHSSRFVLVGSMNPEEGDLRPQLLDRFGLAVTITSPLDPAVRAEAVARRLRHDRGATDPADLIADDRLRDRLAATVPAHLSDQVMLAASNLAVAVGAEGLRADLVLCRAAAAFAGWNGRSDTTVEDVRAVAHLVLAHRRRRGPFDPPTMNREDLDHALDDTLGRPDEHDSADKTDPGDATDSTADAVTDSTAADDAATDAATDSTADSTADSTDAAAADDAATDSADADADDARREPGDDDERSGAPNYGDGSAVRPPSAPVAPPNLRTDQALRPSPASGRRSPMVGLRGRLVGTDPVGTPVTDIALTATAVAVATRWAETGTRSGVLVDDLRQAKRETKAGNLLIFVVDSSGSMGAADRIEAAKGAALGLLTDAYQRRDRVALISMRGERADIVLQPTASGEIARARLTDLPVGGTTPLAEGLQAALRLATSPSADPGRVPLVIVITDGRATFATDDQDPVAAAHIVAAEMAKRGVESVVLDAETGMPRLGLAAELARALGATHLRLDGLGTTRIEDVVRTHLTQRREGR